jgi:hypothetical protein
MQSHLSYFWFGFHYNVDMPRELTRLEMKSVSNTTSYVINKVLIGFLTCGLANALMQGFTSPSGYLLRAYLTEPVNLAGTEFFRRIYGFGPKVAQNGARIGGPARINTGHGGE